jgi:hypothetical protein
VTTTAYRSYVRFRRCYTNDALFILPEHVCAIEEMPADDQGTKRTSIHLVSGHHYEINHTALDVLDALRGSP